MTCRRLLEQRLERMRRIAFSGFALYLIPLPGLALSPWFTILSGLGLVLCMVAATGAFLSLRCIECGAPVFHLLTLTRDRRLVAIRSDLAACPRCGADFDSHHDNSGIPEILSAYEGGKDLVCVVEVDQGGKATRYELALNGDSRDAIRRILRTTPFRKDTAGSYRYFYVPRGRRAGNREDSLTVIRVQQGENMQNIEFSLPPELVRVLEFLWDLGASDQIVTMRLARHVPDEAQAARAFDEGTQETGAKQPSLAAAKVAAAFQ